MGKNYNASLMANHGLIAVGYNIKEALATTEMVEYIAEIYYNAKTMGEPKILNKKQINEVMNKFEEYIN